MDFAIKSRSGCLTAPGASFWGFFACSTSGVFGGSEFPAIKWHPFVSLVSVDIPLASSRGLTALWVAVCLVMPPNTPGLFLFLICVLLPCLWYHVASKAPCLLTFLLPSPIGSSSPLRHGGNEIPAGRYGLPAVPSGGCSPASCTLALAHHSCFLQAGLQYPPGIPWVPGLHAAEERVILGKVVRKPGFLCQVLFKGR